MSVETNNGFLKIDSTQLTFGLPENYITYTLNESMDDLGDEGYTIEINSKGISLTAKNEAGLFYAKKTLQQLNTSNGYPFLKIKDKPRFGYRGLLLDVSRHFFTKEEVMKLLDIMSFYKLNRFHWHLTDDGGWRIELDSYPLLTQQGSYRTDKIWKDWWRNGAKFVPASDKNGFGGYYTKDDIKEVIAYAAERHITVIPEIEFPGHSREVFAAYPELCCAGEPYKSNVFCVGNEDTYTFIDKVLNEVMDVFPSEIIHIGGDETNTRHWQTCPKCRILMEKENMQDVHELHKYIIKKAENIIRTRGRRLAGWDEIGDEKLDKTSVITSWRGDKAGIDAIGQGYDVVFAPLHYLYLDYFQADPNTQPFGHDGYTTIEKVYSYDPVPDTLRRESINHILGIQGQLWSEWIYDMKHLEYMAFPRALAVAEIAWSDPNKRCWPEFRERLTTHVSHLEDAGINSYNLSSNIEKKIFVDTLRKEIHVELKCEAGEPEIRYTTDGAEPNSNSPLYKKTIIVKDSIRLKAASFRNGLMAGEVMTQNLYYHKAIGKSVLDTQKNKPLGGLTDGYTGGKTYLDGTWVNFSGNKELILDLSEVMPIHTVSSRWMQLRAGAKRYLPDAIEIQFSDDGVNFHPGGTIAKKDLSDTPTLQYQEYTLNGKWNARYILIKIVGGRGMSVDELIIL